MRLFFAFDIPPDQRARLANLLPADAPDVRPADPDRMHVTMRFVGAVPEAARDALVRGLETMPLDPGPAEVRGVGTFPATGRPKVLWAGVLVSEPVRRAQETVESLCAEAGIEDDDRPWAPHVTLARVRRGRKPRWIRGFLERHDTFALPPFPVDRIVLYDSVTASDGPRYEPIASRTAR